MSDIRLDRTIFAPREWVAYAWRDPAVLAEWFCPNPGTSVMAELNVNPGGAWKVTMGSHAVRGEYVEVNLPERLEFTWYWEDEPHRRPTRVRVTFTEKSPDSTDLLLEHMDFEDQQDVVDHQEGWTLSLDRLAQAVASRMAASS